jgi:hypothetical protein
MARLETLQILQFRAKTLNHQALTFLRIHCATVIQQFMVVIKKAKVHYLEYKLLLNNATMTAMISTRQETSLFNRLNRLKM